MILHETGAQPSHCFWCPGCDKAHCVDDTKWTVDPAMVTIQPSVLVGGKQWAQDAGFYKPGHAAVPAGGQIVCHSFVANGRIQFLSDSTHTLAGHTVDLPEWPIGYD